MSDHMVRLARGTEIRLAAAALRREILAMAPADGAHALAAAIEAGALDAIPVERALLSVKYLGPVKARQLMRGADIAGDPRLRDVTPARRASLVLMLRKGWRP